MGPGPKLEQGAVSIGDLGRSTPAQCLLAGLKLIVSADIRVFSLVSQANELCASVASAYVCASLPHLNPYRGSARWYRDPKSLKILALLHFYTPQKVADR